MLGPGNEAAAKAALSRHPGSLQVGGGITAANAAGWLDAGAAKVIVTSFLFADGRLSDARLRALVGAVGRNRLVLDLSCRRRQEDYYVVCDRWQTFTALRVAADTLADLSRSCSEFLVHGVDVEGRQAGIEEDLVRILGGCAPIPVTYAGGIATAADVALMEELGTRAARHHRRQRPGHLRRVRPALPRSGRDGPTRPSGGRRSCLNRGPAGKSAPRPLASVWDRAKC